MRLTTPPNLDHVRNDLADFIQLRIGLSDVIGFFLVCGEVRRFREDVWAHGDVALSETRDGRGQLLRHDCSSLGYQFAAAILDVILERVSKKGL